MKLTQQFNSLLKKLSIVDWIFFFLGLAILLGISLFFRREVKFITIKFKVTDENVLYARNSPTNEYALGFITGDVERDELGRVISEITGVESYKTSPDQQVVYLDIKLKAVYNPRKQQYSLQGKSIIYGESFAFSFGKTRFKALVVDFPGFRTTNSIKSEKTIVKAQLRVENRQFSDVYGVPGYVAHAVSKGDTVTDTKGNVLLRILDVTTTPAKRLVMSNSGQPYMVDDPYLMDLYYSIELSTKNINGKIYMFDYLPVLINNAIPINLNTISIWPTITEITDQTPIAQ